MLIFNQLDTKESSFSKSSDVYLAKRNEVSGEVSQLVAEIILKIRSKGDYACVRINTNSNSNKFLSSNGFDTKA